MDNRKRATLSALEPYVADLVIAHTQKYSNPWMPDELLFEGNMSRAHRLEMLQDEAVAIAPELRAVFVLNMLTEEGLPSYHRLLALHLGDETQSAWRVWNDRWTAEEERHATLMHDYVRYTGLVQVREVERLLFQYMQEGFRPKWGSDPYQLLAYTSIQEEATQVSHAGLAKLLNTTSATLTRMLGRIAGEEGTHAHFYQTLYKAIVECDSGAAIGSLVRAVSKFAMPGELMPGYRDLATLAKRLGIFAPRHLQTILRRLTVYWDLEHQAPRSQEGRTAFDQLRRLVDTLDLAQKRVERGQTQSYTFSFLSDPVCV